MKGWSKRKPGLIQKEIRLSAGQLYYRLALEQANFDSKKIDFDAYYKAAESIISSRDKLLLWYSAAISALYFSYVGSLKELSVQGLSLSSPAISYLLLPAIAIISLMSALNMMRMSRYVDLFTYAFNHSRGLRKQDLILRYPKLYTPLHFNSWMTGSPSYMIPIKPWPKRLLAVLILMIPALIGYAVFSLWLLYKVCDRLWYSDPAGLGIWSQIIVVTSVSILLSCIVIPSLSVFKIRFHHVGILSLLERFRRTNPKRYSHFVSMTFSAKERMGLSDRQQSPSE